MTTPKPRPAIPRAQDFVKFDLDQMLEPASGRAR
jgi:hypothetical protein